jgi:acylphosphatase
MMSDAKVAARLGVHGRVQGVGYRFFAEGIAQTLELQGWVRNLPDGDVDVYVEGRRSDIEIFIERLEKGPPGARVEFIKVDWVQPVNRYASFSIIS